MFINTTSHLVHIITEEIETSPGNKEQERERIRDREEGNFLLTSRKCKPEMNMQKRKKDMKNANNEIEFNAEIIC